MFCRSVIRTLAVPSSRLFSSSFARHTKVAVLGAGGGIGLHCLCFSRVTLWSLLSTSSTLLMPWCGRRCQPRRYRERGIVFYYF
ncbi:hypothetical protein B0H13DRAFT_1998295 [Mycena leptocephala]|nr:hypothetical protein B0H13DRAFT_1998295 [Mycena leptocephala]